MKKIISLLLVLLIACSAFVSCGEDKVTDTGTGEATGVVEEGVKLTGDFGGEEFRILSAGNSVPANDFDYDETSVASLDVAQYKRVQKVEQSFNIDITEDVVVSSSYAASGSPGHGFKTVNTQVASGTPNYDLCLIAGYDVTQLALIGYLYDLNSLPNLDLANSWWDQNAIDSLSIKDIVFFTMGDITINHKNSACCFLFSKTIAEEYGIEDPYQIVRDGKWTIEKLTELSKMVSDDLNDDGLINEWDQFGIMVWNGSLLCMVHAAGSRCATINDDGHLELTLYNENTINAFNQFADLAFDDQHALYYHKVSGYPYNWWMNDQGLFFPCRVFKIPSYREREADFGILPFPKLSETQENHYTTFSPYDSQYICVPVVNNDLSRVGLITDALGYYGEKDITPALYDVTLKGQNSRDAESAEMLDIIFENIVYDIGFLFRLGNFNEAFVQCLENKNNAWSSVYETHAHQAQASIETINKAYDAAAALWKK